MAYSVGHLPRPSQKSSYDARPLKIVMKDHMKKLRKLKQVNVLLSQYVYYNWWLRARCAPNKVTGRIYQSTYGCSPKDHDPDVRRDNISHISSSVNLIGVLVRYGLLERFIESPRLFNLIAGIEFESKDWDLYTRQVRTLIQNVPLGIPSSDVVKKFAEAVVKYFEEHRDTTDIPTLSIVPQLRRNPIRERKEPEYYINESIPDVDDSVRPTKRKKRSEEIVLNPVEMPLLQSLACSFQQAQVTAEEKDEFKRSLASLIDIAYDNADV